MLKDEILAAVMRTYRYDSVNRSWWAFVAWCRYFDYGQRIHLELVYKGGGKVDDDD